MKTTVISLVIAAILIVGAFMIARGDFSRTGQPANNISVVDGKQIIVITAKGGYKPRQSVAKAGIPTIIRFNTNGTFDCSSSVRIPSMNISQILPRSGSTDIDIGSGTLGVLKGSCGMGMYPFEIVFEG